MVSQQQGFKQQLYPTWDVALGPSPPYTATRSSHRTQGNLLSAVFGTKGLEENRLPFLVHENLQAEARDESGLCTLSTGLHLLQGIPSLHTPRRLEPKPSEPLAQQAEVRKLVPEGW